MLLSPSALVDDPDFTAVASCSHQYEYELCAPGDSGAMSLSMPQRLRYRRTMPAPSIGASQRRRRRPLKEEVPFEADDGKSGAVGRRRYACYETIARKRRRAGVTFDSYRDLRGVCTHLTATTTFANCATTVRSSFSSSPSSLLVVYLHAFSVLACLAATGLCMRASISNQMPNVSAILSTHSSPMRPNPLLRHVRAAAHREPGVCYVWSSAAPTDLCKLGPWKRLKRLREMSVFNRDCTEANNVQVAQLFRLDWRRIKAESDLHANLEHLRPGIDARDCLLARAGSSECRQCFQKMDKSLNDVEKAYEKFNATLHRFDCMLAVDTASATRPFSPNGSCADCKIWYRKWLLVQLLNVWSEPPCINWCYYAQLACPHLATSKVADYAGHPSFQCRDIHIPPTVPSSSSRAVATSSKRKKSSAVTGCNCIHPCDLRAPPGASDEPEMSVVASQIIRFVGDYAPPSRSEGIYDFFSSPNHCLSRRRYCDAVRQRASAWKESSKRGKTITSSSIGRPETASTTSAITASPATATRSTGEHHKEPTGVARFSNFLELPDESAFENSLAAYMDDRMDMVQLSGGSLDHRGGRSGSFYRLHGAEDMDGDLDEDEDSREYIDEGETSEGPDNYISEWRSRPRSRRRVATRDARSRAEWRTWCSRLGSGGAILFYAFIVISYLLRRPPTV